MNVPLLDLKAQYASIKKELLPVIEQVMESQYFINGPAVGELEKLIADYSGCSAAVGVSSGTDAILCALMTLGIGADDSPRPESKPICERDEVITTPYTFFATVGCIWRAGARPVFVDIQKDSFNIDPSKIESAITQNTKAIMPVHLFGQLADMDPIMDIAKRHNLMVIEDAAQAIGSTYKDRKAGSIGTVGCFSFFPSKNLGGMGDGGMIVTQDPQLGEKLAVFRNHGSKPKYYHRFVGGNFRLDTIQAAGLIVKLRHLDAWSAKRRANAARYDQLLAGISEVNRPVILPHNVSIYNQYVIRGSKRDQLQAHLKQNGIGTEVYYPVSMHEQECFKPLGYKRGDFPVSEQAAAESLALPIYPELTDEQLRYVADTIKNFYAH